MFSRRCFAVVLTVGTLAAGFSPVRAAATTSATATRITRAQPPSPAEYDQLQARHLNQLENPSFETVPDGGKMPADWAVARAVATSVDLVIDADKAQHGQNYLHFHPRRLHFLYGHLRAFHPGNVRVSAAVRGRGRLWIVLDLRGRKRGSHKTISLKRLVVVRHVPIDHQKWSSLAWNLRLPEKINLAGHPIRPTDVTIQIGVIGNLWLDMLAVTPARAPAKTRQTRSSPAPGADHLPLFTIPRLASAPHIDGIIKADEWRHAAAVTGFVTLNTNQPAAQQTVVYAGYDDKRLYFAFFCPTHGRFDPGTPGRDTRMGHQLDAVELWLAPPHGPWIHFVGWPAGGFTDASATGGLKYNAHWDFANHVQQSASSVGGVLTFQDHLWTAELSVPRADLGADKPLLGQRWRINFCRDFAAAADQTRTNQQWTTWSPIKGSFAQPAQFGFVRFGGAAPVVRITRIGDLARGQLSLTARITAANAALQIDARTAHPDGRTVDFQSRIVAAGQSVNLTLAGALHLLQRTPLNYQIQVRQTNTNALIAQQRIHFTTQTLLGVRLVPLFIARRLDVAVDGSRLRHLPASATLSATIIDQRGRARATTSAPWNPNTAGQQQLHLPMASLKVGRFHVSVSLIAKSTGKPLAAATESFTNPTRPSWLGNDLGKTNAVPQPWKPVKTDGRRAFITQRRYDLSDTGLPRQIHVLGKVLFTAPARVELIVHGKLLAWGGKSLHIITTSDRRVTWAIDQTAGPLRMRGTVSVAFDGLARWDVTISSAKPLTIDTLALVFPLRRDRALYARGQDAREAVGRYVAALFTGKSAQPQTIAMTRYSPGAWAWPDQWLDELWIGDDRRGLSVMTETDQYLHGKKRNVITSQGPSRTLRVYLIDGPAKITSPLHYHYAFQATPVKPRPTDPRLTHVGWIRPKAPAFLQRGLAVLDYWALKWISYPALYNRTISRRNFAIYHQHHIKVLPYFIAKAVTTEDPALKPFLPIWAAYPPNRFGLLRGQALLTSPQSQSYQDWVCYSLKRIVDKLHMNGLYLDVSSPSADANYHHGSGYFDPAAKRWKTTVNLFATRVLFQRMRHILKSRHRDGILFQHTVPSTASVGFVDTITSGEEWAGEGTRQYDRLTPALFRAKEMRTQYGTPCTWYVFHHYYRGEQYGGRVPLAAILTYSLPHRILPTDNQSGMWPVWDVMDRYWNHTRFIGYWSAASPLHVDTPDVLASTYLKTDHPRALLVIANWNRHPVTCRLRLDLRALTGSTAPIHLTRALQHPIRDPKDPKNGDPMPNARLKLIGNTITLHLAARDLEVLEATWTKKE